MRQSFLLLGFLSAALSTGCASITHGRAQQVQIHSVPEGLDIKLDGLNICKTPCLAQLERKHGGVVSSEAAGYTAKSIVLDKSISGAFWANIIIGGIPGWIIDGMTGAMYNLSPERIVFIFDEEQAKTIRESWAHPERPQVTYDYLKELPAEELEKAVGGMFPDEIISVGAIGKEKIYGCNHASAKSNGDFADFSSKRISSKDRRVLNKLCEKGVMPDF